MFFDYAIDIESDIDMMIINKTYRFKIGSQMEMLEEFAEKYHYTIKNFYSEPIYNHKSKVVFILYDNISSRHTNIKISFIFDDYVLEIEEYKGE